MDTIDKLSMTHVLVFAGLVFVFLNIIHLNLQGKGRKRLLFVSECVRLTLMSVVLLGAVLGARSFVAEEKHDQMSKRLAASYAQLKEGTHFEKKIICSYRPSKRGPAEDMTKMKMTCKMLDAFATKVATASFFDLKAEWDELIFPEDCSLCTQARDRIGIELNIVGEKQTEIARLERLIFSEDAIKRLLAFGPWLLALVVSLSFFRLTADFFR